MQQIEGWRAPAEKAQIAESDIVVITQDVDTNEQEKTRNLCLKIPDVKARLLCVRRQS